ncbi:MAG: flippase-like domain-containing protein [Chitinophagaceae bacterium]|nr:MAG: flippase-like domain-containing protein [Chitinophagaceae bacterium]
MIKYGLGPLVFCILALSIYHQVQRQPDWQNSFRTIGQGLSGTGIWYLVAVFVLMFVNWGIEARKWQLALRSLTTISFGRSFKAVFTGTTLAFFTPNRIGEYFGRILFIKEGTRLQAISLTIVCSIAQLMVTVIGGVVGFIFFKAHLAAEKLAADSTLFWLQIVYYVALFGALILTLLYFRLSWLVRLARKITPLAGYLRYVKVLETFNATILIRILSLSFARYIIFLLQYFILFRVFDVELNWMQNYWVVSVMFIVLSIAPTIAFITDLGIRAKASIELVQFFSSNVVGILATSLSIWLINLVIPALIGSLLILGFKFRDNFRFF